MDRIKKIASRLGIVIILFLIIWSLFGASSDDTFTLTITATPSDAVIKVTNQTEAQGRFEKRLKQGKYTIKVEKNDHASETREVNLNTDLTIDINLKTSVPENINIAEVKSNPVSDISEIYDNKVYGVDDSTGDLISLENNNSKIIYTGSVKDFNISGSTAIVLDNDNLTEITLINLDNNSQRKINLANFAPIASITLSNDAKKLYFLGNFKISNKTPTLYSTDVQNINPEKLTDTRGLEIEFVNENNILLFEKVHEENRSMLHFYDPKEKKVKNSAIANFYKLSPDKSKVLLQANNTITVVDTKDLLTKFTTLLEGELVAWKDNNTIVLLQNTANGAEIATATISPYSLSGFQLILKSNAIQNVYGISNSRLYFQDYFNKVGSVNLP